MINRLTKLLRLAQRLAPRLLAGYLTVLFIATHIPQDFPTQAGLIEGDKLIHLVAYALLGLLLTMALYQRSSVVGWSAFTVVLGLAMAIGAADELTQPWFNRVCDPVDWLCDVLGAAVGFAVFVVARRSGWLPPMEGGKQAAGAQ